MPHVDAPPRIAYTGPDLIPDGPQPHTGPHGTGGLVGCGPLSAASLLHAHAQLQHLPVPDRDTLAHDLRRWQQAFLVPGTGGQRATLPWTYLTGLNAYLRAHDLPLHARGRWGYRLHGPLRRHADAQFRQGRPVVGLEFSPRQQHYALLRAVTPGPTLNAEPYAGGAHLHLTPRAGLGGVFWLEDRFAD